MKKSFRSLSLAIVICMLFSVLTMLNSCVQPENGSNEQNSANTTTDVASVVTTPADPLTELEVVDLQEDEINFLWPVVHGDGHFSHNELACSETTGDRIDNAVFSRNSMIESQYNISIVADTLKCSDIATETRAEFKAGETDAAYDAIATNIAFMMPIAIEGILTDFENLEYYSEDQEWWNHKLMSDFSIATQKFFATGDIIYSDDFYPYCVFANPSIATNVGINDDLFELVKTNEWTLDKMVTFAQQAAEDLDGTLGHTVDDKHGMVVNANYAKATYYSSGKKMIRLDAEGYPTWDMDNDSVQSVLDKLNSFWRNSEYVWTAQDKQIGELTHAQVELELFNSSKTLFLVEELIFTERISKSEAPINDFIILPLPLYKKGLQYTSMLNDSVVISIPVRVKDKDKSSLVLSAMSRASIDTLTPAFFEIVLKAKYVNDPDSVDMLNIILNSTVPQDVATIQDWGGMMKAFKKFAEEGKESFQSEYKVHITAAMKALDDYITQLEAVDNIQK